MIVPCFGVMLLKHWVIMSFLVGAISVCLSSEASASILVKEGSQGAPVRRVQSLLIEQGFLDGADDGICGEQTVEAIKKFQESRGLTVDGVCGDGTYYYLSDGEDYDGPPCDDEAEDEEERDEQRGKPYFVQATGYSSADEGNGEYTCTGTRLHHGIIAVDPAVIPLGTRVYIPGYGEAIADDTGGMIKGDRIDLAFETQQEAIDYGRQNIEIYILN